jgi:glycerophosphoryl diester phosphodiesterase
MTLIIAHRGASGQAIQNSLAAFRKALDACADGVELDVHASKDGALVVHHDADLPAGRIAALPFQRIRGHRLANGEAIPTLEESLAAIGDACDAYIEIKGLAPEFDGHLFAAIDACPAPHHCRVHAFDHRIIRRLTAARPALGAGVLSSSYPVDPVAPFQAAGATDLWMEQSMVDRELVDRVHDAGGRVFAWTTDAPRRMRELADYGVDAICTNQPAEARSILG